MSGETAEAAPAPKSGSSSSWVTLATNDSYAVGALVLAASLRKAETKHPLTVLITHGVTDHMKNVLSEFFDLVHLVDPLDSGDENRLELMSRPELGITLTKIHCWTLTNINKGVFLDADTLIIQNCDELFERDEFSAAPDVGWPDCFNSGVFVFKPSLETFRNLVQCALTKGSFDGGDQGLLNTYFSEWASKDISRHLPFIYNMVSSATYTYLPAFLKYGSEARIVHFLGAGNKPWLAPFDWSRGVATAPAGAQHSLPLLQLWWDLYSKSVHGKLTREMGGLAGVLAQMTIGGTPTPAEQTLADDLNRRQAWEQGIIDYTGRDAFENIWKKICQTLAAGPAETSQIPAGSQPAPVDIETKETQEPIVPATPEEKKAFAIVPVTPPPVLDEFVSVKRDDVIALPSPVPENAPEGLVAPQAPKIIETPATPGTPDVVAPLPETKSEDEPKPQVCEVVKEQQTPAAAEQQADQPGPESKSTETQSSPVPLDSTKEQATTKTEEVGQKTEKKEESSDVASAPQQVVKDQSVSGEQAEIKPSLDVKSPDVPEIIPEPKELTPISSEQTQSTEQVSKASESSTPVIEQKITPLTQPQEQSISTPSPVQEESVSPAVPTPEQSAPTPIPVSEQSTPPVTSPEQASPAPDVSVSAAAAPASEPSTPAVTPAPASEPSAPEAAPAPVSEPSAPTPALTSEPSTPAATPAPASEPSAPTPASEPSAAETAPAPVSEPSAPTPVPATESSVPAPTPAPATESSVPAPTPVPATEPSVPAPTPVPATEPSVPSPTPVPATESSVPAPTPVPATEPSIPAAPVSEQTVSSPPTTTTPEQSATPTAPKEPTIPEPVAEPTPVAADQTPAPSVPTPSSETPATVAPVPATPEKTSAPVTEQSASSPAEQPSTPPTPATEKSSASPTEGEKAAVAAPVTTKESTGQGAAAAAPASPVAAAEAPPTSPVKEATGADPPVPPKRKGKKKSH